MSVHVSLLLLHYFLFWGNVLVRFSQLRVLYFFLKYPGATKVTFCQQPGQNDPTRTLRLFCCLVVKRHSNNLWLKSEIESRGALDFEHTHTPGLL